MEHKGEVASFVQTRGSMPFYWTQMPCIKYMPKPVVTGTQEDNLRVVSAHFSDQVSHYGQQVIINLVNQKKDEGKLEKTFETLVSSMARTDVHYEAFDFHRECSKMRYERLNLLRDQLASYDFGFFHRRGSSLLATQVSHLGYL